MHVSIFPAFTLLAFVLPTALGLAVDPNGALTRHEDGFANPDKPTELTEAAILEGLTFDGREDLNFSGADTTAKRDIMPRGAHSSPVCLRRIPGPRSGGVYQFHGATCDRPGSEQRTFKVACEAQNNRGDIIYRLPGTCDVGEVCMEFHGLSTSSESTWDITCAAKSRIHKFVVDTMKNPGHRTGCGAGWKNTSGKNVKYTFETDVLDSAISNRIKPQEVYFQLDQKRIGISRFDDSDVGSGAVVVPNGGVIQPCIIAHQGQILNAYSALLSAVFA